MIIITFKKEHLTHHVTESNSMVYVYHDDCVQGTIAFYFEPYIVSETEKTIDCAFSDDGLTTIKFYYPWGLGPNTAIVSNRWLKAIVEGW